MNDTHPTVAVAELMRILLDEEGLELGRGMGDHDEDLCVHEPHHHGGGTGEVADRAVLQRLLPRIYQIVEEINRRFVNEIQSTAIRATRRRSARWRSSTTDRCRWHIWRS